MGCGDSGYSIMLENELELCSGFLTRLLPVDFIVNGHLVIQAGESRVDGCDAAHFILLCAVG